MPFVTFGTTDHDNLVGVSTSDHHTATVAGDLNLADMAERLHASLTSVGNNDHLSDVTQSNLETEEVTARTLRPDLLKHSPGISKVWVKWEQTGAHSIRASYNMTSVTDGSAAGDTDHLYDVDFSSAEYCLVGGNNNNGTVGRTVGIRDGTQLAGGCTTLTEDVNNVNVDSDENTMCIFGDH